MHQINRDSGPGYIAEGEIPGNMPVVFVGTEAAPRPTWREVRARRNRLRHLCCDTRTGSKVIDGDDGLMVVETAT